MFAIAQHFVTKYNIPICTFVSNGGVNSLREVYNALEKKWPL